MNDVCRGMVAVGSGWWTGQSGCDGIEWPIQHVDPEPPIGYGLRCIDTTTIYCISVSEHVAMDFSVERTSHVAILQRLRPDGWVNVLQPLAPKHVHMI